jgi:hypothetical protein
MEVSWIFSSITSCIDGKSVSMSFGSKPFFTGSNFTACLSWKCKKSLIHQVTLERSNFDRSYFQNHWKFQEVLVFCFKNDPGNYNVIIIVSSVLILHTFLPEAYSGQHCWDDESLVPLMFHVEDEIITFVKISVFAKASYIAEHLTCIFKTISYS